MASLVAVPVPAVEVVEVEDPLELDEPDELEVPLEESVLELAEPELELVPDEVPDEVALELDDFVVLEVPELLVLDLVVAVAVALGLALAVELSFVDAELLFAESAEADEVAFAAPIK